MAEVLVTFLSLHGKFTCFSSGLNRRVLRSWKFKSHAILYSVFYKNVEAFFLRLEYDFGRAVGKLCEFFLGYFEIKLSNLILDFP